MKKSSLIGHAVEAFALVNSRKDPADTLLHRFFRDRHYLGSKDRRFIADTVYGMIREERMLRYFAEQAIPSSKQGPSESTVHPVFLYLVFAARVLAQLPAQIVDDVGESGLVGAKSGDVTLERFLDVVGSLDSPMSAISDPALGLAVAYSMPDCAVNQWMARLGRDECEALCAGLNKPAPLSIRVNLLQGPVASCRSTLDAEGVSTSPGRISPEALVLEKRVNIQSLESFRNGLFEMQDEGSQLISHLVSPLSGETVLDACAGGGGKSLHMAALMNNKGTLFASDVSALRLRQAVRRAERAGVGILKPCEAGSSAPVSMCDRVLVDVPCSGSGAWRRNPWGKRGMTPEAIAVFSARQHRILQDFSAYVRVGGRLVYATCSLFAEENEEVVKGFLDTTPDFRLLNATEILRERGIAVAGDDEFLSLAPHRDGTDGFFAAAMVRVR